MKRNGLMLIAVAALVLLGTTVYASLNVDSQLNSILYKVLQREDPPVKKQDVNEAKTIDRDAVKHKREAKQDAALEKHPATNLSRTTKAPKRIIAPNPNRVVMTNEEKIIKGIKDKMVHLKNLPPSDERERELRKLEQWLKEVTEK
jgi:hypothetical protein